MKSDSETSLTYSIRRAKKKDTAAIYKILAKFAKEKLVLPRSLEEIKRDIKVFKVAEVNQKVVGCCAIRDYGRGLCEIRSLGVLKTYNGHGIGTALVKSWLSYLKRHGIKRIFALTYRPHIFERLGFKIVNKELFPEKIWTDCAVCSKKEKCDEIAVLKKYED